MLRSAEPGRPVRRHGVGERLRSRSGLLLIGLNVALCLFLGHWVIENIHPDRLVEQLARIPVSAILVSIAINLTALAIYGVRMAMLLGGSFWTAFAVVGLMVSRGAAALPVTTAV